LNELNANKEAFIKSKNNGTSWCCWGNFVIFF
jgi:hypothetical protein